MNGKTSLYSITALTELKPEDPSYWMPTHDEGKYMTDVVDQKQDFITAKSKENIVAFAGFHFFIENTAQHRDGLLTITSRKRNDGSGYITLTFMIDAENDPTINQLITQTFRKLNKSDLSSRLGEEFKTLLETDIEFDRNENWFMDSFTFYFQRIDNIKKYHIEDHLIPTFALFLPLKIDPIEWLPEGASVPFAGENRMAGVQSVKGIGRLLRKVFGR
jgi:hypothetical protein